ncbi:MAG: precorrin-8X methylmutase [Clostridia bacterium BRH_c25]|nr:MAG: precorrin-8X methylmutase [Clostridia bacterium BRH_c25]
MYLKNPEAIEAKSMEIIDQGMNTGDFDRQELKVIKRTIHTTGDFDYQNIITIKKGSIHAGISAIKSGCRIVTDTKMAFSGINKRSLEAAGCSIDCYISEEEIYRIAMEKQITRSMAAMDHAAETGVDIFVIGNAPTALFRIGELISEGRVSPKLIVGVPVGFVGAAESKEYIRRFEVPSITTVGTKGGSNVAAAIMNALIYMAVGRDA